MRILLTLSALAFATSSLALNNANKPKPSTQPGYSVCPKISQLHLDPDTKRWSATGGWKTFTVSFAIKTNRFLGAQWEGTNVGNIFCIYQGIALHNKQTFNIHLQHPGLVDQPSGGKWSKNLGGYQNCMSSKQDQCQFKPFHPEKTGNMYQTLDSLKTAPIPQIGY